jgi:transcriptional regulator with XRE-family HTH domain
MKIMTIGERLRTLRGQKNRSQRYLSKQTGISQTRISQIEDGRQHPTKKEWEQLQRSLGAVATPLPVKLQRPYPNQAWATNRPELSWTVEAPVNARIYRARKSFGPIFDKLLSRVAGREDAPLSFRFLNDAGLDSGDEAAFWIHGFAVGGRACWYSPVRAGFRSLPIVDGPEERKVIGDLRHPCLEILRANYGILLFPQLRLITRRGFYRLDALACIRRGRKRCWVNIEIDGGGHDGEFDAERESQLRLPTIRLRKSHLADPAMFASLEQRLLDILDDRQTK